ncbi:MAG: SDR family oxidoreductase [Tenericutes bacterium]|nr:SDR family oxidoreductase [Mycoplasmatota bacterium]
MKKVVLITGGSRGIGKSTAIEFAKNGYNIIINYLSDDKSAEHIKSFLVENYDVDVMTYKCDVKDELKVKCMVEDVINYFGRIDVLVNNAAIAIDTLVEDKNKDDFKKILDTNLIGPFILSRSVAKVMMKNKKGSIINVSSTNAIDTYYEYSLDYDASKAALISLTHNLAKYYAPYIRVNAVAPGWVDTDMNKNLSLDYIKKECEDIYLKRFGKPEEIAKAIYFLASDNASYITGEVLRVDGGYNHG